MKKLTLKKNEGAAEGYKELCFFALASARYSGPDLIKMMDVRDKIKNAKDGDEIDFEDAEWNFLKQKVNETSWPGQSVDIAGPFVKEFSK